MKAFLTVIDDDGNVVYKDKLLEPVREEVIVRPYHLPMKEVRFSFIITLLADLKTL